jgi:SRSO17 transposase
LGKTANGMVSVNAYAVVDKVTYPLLFRIYKPRPRLQAGDIYQSKPQIAIDLLRAIKAWLIESI